MSVKTPSKLEEILSSGHLAVTSECGPPRGTDLSAISEKAEIIKNQRLESQVQIYRDSLKLTHTKYNSLKLALLDKAIKKAKKEKVVRDKKEAEETKEEIEQELLDKRLNAEQAEWEKNNADVNVELAPDTLIKEEISAPAPKKEAEIKKEARPLPVQVRKARKKEN